LLPPQPVPPAAPPPPPCSSLCAMTIPGRALLLPPLLLLLPWPGQQNCKCTVYRHTQTYTRTGTEQSAAAHRALSVRAHTRPMFVWLTIAALSIGPPHTACSSHFLFLFFARSIVPSLPANGANLFSLSMPLFILLTTIDSMFYAKFSQKYPHNAISKLLIFPPHSLDPCMASL